MGDALPVTGSDAGIESVYPPETLDYGEPT